ncbi:MAG: carboxypeptidase regulatory-like domain-containing protein, partial [Bacteroidales bacterium]|nr:carboxypeptidase regulatory-like domain-containing protein [Bacteroidales bacterium]
MNFKSIIKSAVLGSMLLGALASCKKDPQVDNSSNGSIVGTVVDNLDNPIEGVTVKVKDAEGTAVTAADGTFTLKNVPVARQSVTFTKAGYLSVTTSVAATKFNADKVATISVVMQVADAKITGRVVDGSMSPVGGATVSVSESKSTVSGEDGRFELTDLLIQDYTLTI